MPLGLLQLLTRQKEDESELTHLAWPARGLIYLLIFLPRRLIFGSGSVNLFIFSFDETILMKLFTKSFLMVIALLLIGEVSVRVFGHAVCRGDLSTGTISHQDLKSEKTVR
ncbi:MAG: hypothetical protein MZW92_32755 [Comamonadaceae bacterium]|nr:hypothetical protein [Comamonadaceae bacterium]